MLPPTYIVTLGYCWPVIISKLYFVSLLKEDSSSSYCPLSVHGWSVYIVWMLGFAQSFSACVPVQNCLKLVLDIFYFYFPFFFLFIKRIYKNIISWRKILCWEHKTEYLFVIFMFWYSLWKVEDCLCTVVINYSLRLPWCLHAVSTSLYCKRISDQDFSLVPNEEWWCLAYSWKGTQFLQCL